MSAKGPKTTESLYQEAFWTLWIAMAAGIVLMMLGTALLVLQLITLGLLLQVVALPLTYYLLTKAERNEDN